MSTAMSPTGAEARSPRDLRGLLDTGALVAAGALVGFGILMAIAANWDGLGKWGRFSLVAAALTVSALGAILSNKARVPLSLAGIMSIGGLFALIGQTYQTGADPWQLFALWAALALPWALAARSDAVWSALVVVAFAAIGLYFQIEAGPNWLQAESRVLPLWLVAFAITAALSPFAGIDEWTGPVKWAFRLAAVLTALLVLSTTIPAILDDKGSNILVLAGYAVVGLAILAIVMTHPLDVALLAVYVLALDVLIITGIAYLMFVANNPRVETGSFLGLGLIATAVVAGSAAAILKLIRTSDGATPAISQAASASRTWPVVVMTGIGALLAAVPFIAFLGATFGVFLEKGGGTYLVGGAILAGAATLLRSKGDLGFGQQFGIIAFITGLILFGFGLYRDLSAIEASLALFVLVTGLALLMPDDWTVGLMGALAGGFAAYILSDLVYLAYGIHDAGYTPYRFGAGAKYVAAIGALGLIALQERSGYFGAREDAAGRYLSGLAAAALVLVMWSAGQTFLLFGGWGGGWTPAVPHQQLPLVNINLVTLSGLAMTAFACWWLARKFPDLTTPTGLAAAALLLILTLFAPSLGAAVLVGAAALTTDRRSLALLAAFAGLWLIGTFYYWLGWPLTHKAYLMAGLGLALGAVAYATHAKLSAILPGGETRAPLMSGPLSTGLTAALILASAAATGVLAAQTIRQKEAIIETGRTIYVPLAPVDPRSLMQGDYMALRFELPLELPPPEVAGDPPVRAVAMLDSRGIAKVTTLAGASYKPGSEEIIINLARKHGRWMFATDAWYFKEGTADTYAKAKFGEFRVSPDGDALLVGLADEGLQGLK